MTAPDAQALARFSDALRERFPDEQETFDSYEEEVARWDGLFRQARGMAHYEERRLRDTGERTARRQIGHLIAATVVRVVDLADGLVVLVNAERTHAAFATARALIETAAVPAYILKNVVPHLARGRGDRVDDVLTRLSVGLDPGLDVEGWPRDTLPIPVSSLVKALTSEMDKLMPPQPGEDETAGTTMRRLYSLVSDHTHPNNSAVHLSAAIDENGMDWDRFAGWSVSTLHDIEGPTFFAMYGGRTALEDVMAAANKHRVVLNVKPRPDA
jgi:hypothetical protein